MIKNISKIFGNNITLILAWFFYAISPLVEMVRYKFYFWFFSENNYFLLLLKIGIKVYLWVFLVINLLIMIVWYKNIIKANYLKSKHYITLVLVALMTILLEIFIRIVLFVDQSHYPNYIFSTYGIKSDFLNIMSVVNYLFVAIIVAILVSIYERKIKTVVKKEEGVHDKKINLLNINTIINIFSIVVLSFMSVYPFVSIPIFFSESRQTYDQRIGREYIYIEALVKLTPVDSVVIHPPQSVEWPLFGNQPINRYFLFPRTLISGKLVNSPEYLDKFNEVYFVLVDQTDMSPVWPQIINNKKKIIFDMYNEVSFSKIELIGQFSDKKVYKLTL